MNFMNLKLPLISVATLSLLLPSVVGFAADNVTTDGKVTFELDSSDMGIVQPGTNTHLLIDTDGADAVGSAGTKVEQATGDGFVQILFAPNFEFGTVKANYKADANYYCNELPAQAEGKTAGWIDPFVQVADYTDGTYSWSLDLEMSKRFESEQHVLVGATLKFLQIFNNNSDSNIFSDLGSKWNATDFSLNKFRKTRRDTGTTSVGVAATTLTNDGSYSKKIPILYHDAHNEMINGAKWSYTFGLPIKYESTSSDYNGPTVNSDSYVSRISQTKQQGGRTTAVQLFVPKEAKPKVGREYIAELTWSLSNTIQASDEFDFIGTWSPYLTDRIKLEVDSSVLDSMKNKWIPRAESGLMYADNTIIRIDGVAIHNGTDLSTLITANSNFEDVYGSNDNSFASVVGIFATLGDPNGMAIMNLIKGLEGEHVISFQYINPSSGAIDPKEYKFKIINESYGDHSGD
ncbi:MAG: WxL domain-containing protein [Lactobacillales bacterium]|jgi:hypothetical protein|nr:WxL domain-containing protein [Lactobacillales bacterium]